MFCCCFLCLLNNHENKARKPIGSQAEGRKAGGERASEGNGEPLVPANPPAKKRKGESTRTADASTGSEDQVDPVFADGNDLSNEYDIPDALPSVHNSALGLNVPNNIKAKIIKGQYVDLSQLLDTHIGLRKIPGC